MGANRNHDEERRVVGSWLLSGLDGYGLDADCGSPFCGGDRLVLAAALIPRWGHLSVWEAVKRLRCRRCGRRAAGVTFRRLVRPDRRSPNDLCLEMVARRTDGRERG